MLKAQQDLLADISAAEQRALTIANRGVKISGVVQKLRAARDELAARVRYIEKAGEAKPAAKPSKPPKAVEDKPK